MGKSHLLDLGLQLDAKRADQSLLPPVEGLENGENPNLLEVVLSHPHSDHYGLLECVHSSVPVYVGDGARRLLDVASAFTSGLIFTQPVTRVDGGWVWWVRGEPPAGDKGNG
jgi:ribonuclease J